MTDVIVKVPQEIKDIIGDDTSETIYVETLKEVARKKISHTQKQLKELKRKISVYERKYGRSYEEFLQNIPDTLKGHEDWIEWSYLVNVAHELSAKLEKLRLLIGS